MTKKNEKERKKSSSLPAGQILESPHWMDPATMATAAKAKNESITFRINTDDLEQLKALASDDQVSLNTLVNKILRSYLEWDHSAAKAGNAIIMQKCILKAIFDFMPENELEKIAVEAADNKDELLGMTGKADLEAALSIIARRAKRSGFILRDFSDAGTDHDDKKIHFVIQHDMGRKWSAFFKAYNQRLINNTGHATKIEATDKLVTIRVGE